jgi:hypothetical protein
MHLFIYVCHMEICILGFRLDMCMCMHAFSAWILFVCVDDGAMCKRKYRLDECMCVCMRLAQEFPCIYVYDVAVCNSRQNVAGMYMYMYACVCVYDVGMYNF